MLIKQAHLSPGDWIGFAENQLRNRTGATLSRGQVGMIDFLTTQTEVDNFTPGAENSSYETVTPVTQAGYGLGYPIVVALEDIVDNAYGRFCFYGHVEVAVLDDDVSTTDIDVGDTVGILVSESAVAVQAAVTTTRAVGHAHENAAADSTNTDRTIDASSHLRFVSWYGGVPMLGLNTDTDT